MKKILLLFILLTGSLYAQPPIGQPNNLAICDQNSDGFEAFDLTVTIPEILNGLNPSLYTVIFYTSLADAQNEMAPIANPSSYLNTFNPHTIFVRVLENANPTNFAITSFDLIVVLELQFNIAGWNTASCEAPFMPFFLALSGTPNSTVFFTVNGGAEHSIVINESGVFQQMLEIVSETSTICFTQIVSNIFPFCSKSLADIECILTTVFPSPILSQPENLIVYESPFDGIAIFDLTVNEAVILSNANLEEIDNIEYYFGDELIQNPMAYQNLNNNSTIKVRVTNLYGCVSEVTFDLIVAEDGIVFIPDINFKARLLSASPTVQVAQNGFNNWITIDTNNDGEIQISEALEVTYFRLNSFLFNDNEKINSLEGINSFLNLTYLDCNFNLLSDININLLTNLVYFECAGNNLSTLTLQNFSNLIEIKCGINPLTSLNLQSIPNLQYLACNDTLLTELDVTQFTNLSGLDCNSSQLTSLTVNNLPNLGAINCPNNQLSTINLEGLISLYALNANDNLLTSLDVQQIPLVSQIQVNNNQLTTLNVDGLNNLLTLRCNNNLFTTLNIENLPSIQEFRCSENSLLETLFIKNGIDEFIWAVNCPNLIYICADETQIQSIQSLGSAGNPDDYVINSYCTFLPGGNYNSITGKIIMDGNSNGCDTQDIPQPNIRVDINDGVVEGASFTNNSGDYAFYTQAGSFVLTPNIENPSWFNFSPPTITIPFLNNDNNSIIQNFCITPNGFHPDVEIVVSPIFPARPGYEAVYQIVFKNKGNQTLSQANGISFSYNTNFMNFVSASTAPTTMDAGVISWSYVNLIPFESRNIYITFNINSSTDTNPVNSGDVLQFTSTIVPIIGDETPADNTFVFNQVVVDSYVTNSITCVEGNLASTSQIGEYLHYIINFENTGTASAENIIISLSINENDFDSNTLQILKASHEVDARIKGDKVEFIFQNILLESGGHGNILLKMKTHNTMQSGNYVQKKATIYYNYNLPIETNMAVTLFQELSVDNPLLDSLITLYPNPSSDRVNIQSDDSNTIKTVELYDIQGRLLQTTIVNNISTEINLLQRTNGMYFVKINTMIGSKVVKLIKN